MSNSIKVKSLTAALPFAGMIGALIISGLAALMIVVYKADHHPAYFHFVGLQFIIALPFFCLFQFHCPMRFFSSRSTQKILLRHMTFLSTTVQGVAGNLLMLADLPDAFNSFTTPLWFTFGFTFFNLGGARFKDIVLYGSLYLFSLLGGMKILNIPIGPDEYLSFIFIMFQWASFTPLVLMARGKVRALQHAFKQLEKVFYPHQIESIRRATELEQTMPTHAAHAYVISFDIIESSKIQPEQGKELFRKIFQHCNAIMMQGYDGKERQARAYRIKEMGDGFLCSVGYPFRSPKQSLANESLRLAEEFYEVFFTEAQKLNFGVTIHCGIGVAVGPICGFFPETRPKEYDLYGQSIVLAKRYEGMRKFILLGQKPASVIILQEEVFLELDESSRKEFIAFDLKQKSLSVRDDPLAEKLYYKTAQ